ncbi:MAG: heme NO-binding domain-containing protein [Pseudomonadota bacterium]
MRGTMFVEFFDHVERHHGIDVVDRIIEESAQHTSTGGAYTSVGNYPHGELLALATALSNVCGEDLVSIIDKFAIHIMDAFKRMHPEYFEVGNAFDFLSSVGASIHKDVRKLYPDANPPEVEASLQADGSLLLHYRSHRPLAHLALALTRLATQMYGETIDVEIVEMSAEGNAAAMRLRRAQ